MAKDNPAKESMDGVITDKRFSRLHSNPRFMRLPRNKFKVQIDSRFQHMFSDEKFSESSAVDKRGKSKKKKKDKNALLEYYYRQHQEEEKADNVNKHTLYCLVCLSCLSSTSVSQPCDAEGNRLQL